jgi:hypothetical protein
MERANDREYRVRGGGARARVALRLWALVMVFALCAPARAQSVPAASAPSAARVSPGEMIGGGAAGLALMWLGLPAIVGAVIGARPDSPYNVPFGFASWGVHVAGTVMSVYGIVVGVKANRETRTTAVRALPFVAPTAEGATVGVVGTF